MQNECKFAGFGGQGILTIGKLMALAGLAEGREVVWIPSYGPEMRGGTAYCTVVVADKPIGSPVINNPRNLVVMNRPSLEKFDATVRPGGIIVINSSLIPVSSKRDDVDVLRVGCNAIANELGNARVAGMIALGAFVARSGIVAMEALEEVVGKTFAAKPAIAALNRKALARGAEIARCAPPFVADTEPTGAS